MIDAKAVRECSKQERSYPEIRGAKYKHGFDCGTCIGKTIWCIAHHPEVKTTVDFFANSGSGAILSTAHAQQESEGDKVAYSVERDAKQFPEIDKNLEGYKNVMILKGNVEQHAPFIETLDIDLVTYDPDPPIQDWLFGFVNNTCQPKIWVYHNTNYSLWRKNYSKLISEKKYTEIIKGVSPEITYKKTPQEFSVFVRSDLL